MCLVPKTFGRRGDSDVAVRGPHEGGDSTTLPRETAVTSNPAAWMASRRAASVTAAPSRVTARAACGARDLVVLRDVLSPAHAGAEMLDDGATATLVTRLRPPCPKNLRRCP